MKFNVLSLFSSAGIAETYFERNCLKVKVASEILPERVKLYKHLYPEVKMIEGDINDSGVFSTIINESLKEKVDFIIATPPCQGMSTAGKMQKDDPRNRLIINAVNAITIIKPKFVIIENVPEILNTKIKIGDQWILIEDYLHRELTNYNFNKNNVVNAMNYGVAQSRLRCVFLLSRKDTGIIWEFPKPNEKVITMRDAIGNLPSLDPNVTDISIDERNKYFPDYEKKRTAGLEVSPWHIPPKHKFRHVLAMMHTPEGCSAWNNEFYYPTLADGTKSKGYKNTYKRQWWDKPAYTITKYTSRLGSQENGHPGRIIIDSENEKKRIISDARTMTIFELMRLSSLPDNWNIPLNSSANLIREVIGEGVPPALIESALKELEKLLND